MLKASKVIGLQLLLCCHLTVKIDCTNFILGVIYNLQRTMSSCGPAEWNKEKLSNSNGNALGCHYQSKINMVLAGMTGLRDP